MTKEFLDIHELSEYLSIKRSTLYTMVESGDLPHYRIGRLIRFKRNDVDGWLETHRRERTEIDKRAEEILTNTTRQRVDIDAVVKKSIEEVKNSRYNLPHGKSDRIKGLRKEVEDGTL